MGIYFSQTSVIFLCLGFSCCLCYWGVRNSEVSIKQELPVFIVVVVFIIVKHFLHDPPAWKIG